MGEVELRLLGPMSLKVDGLPVPLGPARQRPVLAALAVDAGRPVRVDVLIGRLKVVTRMFRRQQADNFVVVQSGDEILIRRTDDTTVRFTVDHVDRVPKTQFPTDDVYGDTADPELRLITCGGAFDHDAHSYRDNVIVYAVMAA